MHYRCCGTSLAYNACPHGYQTVGGMCVYEQHFPPATHHSAQARCEQLGAHVCEHNEAWEMCGHGHDMFNPYHTGWFGDHGTASGGNWDDEYGTWSRAYCIQSTVDNTDEAMRHYSSVWDNNHKGHGHAASKLDSH